MIILHFANDEIRLHYSHTEDRQENNETEKKKWKGKKQQHPLDQ